MPYKCTVCNKLYMEGSDELKEIMGRGGCTCGKKFLMYVPAKKEKTKDSTQSIREKIKTEIKVETEASKKEEENKDFEWLGKELVKMRETDEPLYLGIETIRVLEEGKYELDVPSLMSGKPLVVKSGDGVYYIDLGYSMKKK